MRFRLTSSWLFLGLLFPATPGFSETGLEDDAARLVVTVVEYQTTITPEANVSPSEIVAQLRESDTEPVRTIRLSTLSNCEAAFRAGESIAVPQHGSGVKGDPVFVEIGTELRLTAKRTDTSVLMNLDYTTSRLTNQETASSSPRVKELTVQGTYAFQLGEPVLIGGLTASDEFSYLVATVTEPTPRAQPTE